MYNNVHINHVEIRTTPRYNSSFAFKKQIGNLSLEKPNKYRKHEK
jgi:hypothetical protein